MLILYIFKQINKKDAHKVLPISNFQEYDEVPK